jgi:hypothetical protein
MTPHVAEQTPAAGGLGRRGWMAVGIVAVVCLLPFWGLWRAPGPPMEEGFMLVFPELVLEGMVPNRDFLHLYGPGSLWVLAAAYRVFGTTLEVQRAVGFLQLLGIIFGVLALLRPWGWRLAALGAIASAVVILPPTGLTAMAWVGAVALGLWSVALGLSALPPPTSISELSHAGGGHVRNGRLIGAGLLGAAALLYRPDLVIAVVGAGIVIGLGLGRPGRVRYAGAFAAGCATFGVHVALAGPGNVIRGLVYEPVVKLRGGRSLPLPPSWDDLDGFLQRAGRLDEPPWPLPALESPQQLVLWVGALVLASGVLLVAGTLAFRRRGDRRLLAMAVFAAGLLPQAMQRPDSTHLAWVSCVAFGLLPAALAELGLRRRPLVAGLVPLLVLLWVLPDFTFRSYVDAVAQGSGVRPRNVGTMERDGRIFYYGRKDAVAAVADLLDEVERMAEPGDRLFVGTGDLRKTPYSEAFLYYLLPELVPATRFIEMDPGVANADGSGMADDLASADVVILSSIRDDWAEPNDSRKFGSSESTVVLDERFCQVGSFGVGLFGRGLYELYLPCDPAATGP